jgi:thioredoxin-related protein
MRFFVITIFLFSLLQANHVSWYANFDKAHQQALKEKKNLMVLLIEKECVACVEALKDTFMNKKYIDKINNNFISVLITKGQKSSYPIEMLYTFEYPSLFFLDNTELFICEPIRGGVTPDKLDSYLEKCK